MQKLLNIRFSFYLRSSHKKSTGKTPIYFRIQFRGERTDLSTGLVCYAHEWDADNGNLYPISKNAIALNRNLDEIVFKAKQTFDELNFRREPFTIDELVDKIKGREQKPAILKDYLEDRVKEISQRIDADISKSTFEKYRRSGNHLKNFIDLEYKSNKFPVYKIDHKLLEKYFQYLRATKKISHNAAIKYMGSLKTILIPAIKSNLIRIDPFKELKLRPKPVYRNFLTKEEIDQLATTCLSSNDLERIRDIFLFACYTGLAYVDISQLRSFHITKDQDDYFIIKPRQKTGQQSIIPLLPPAVRILKKYSITEDCRGFNWHVSANQKMNQRLKTIGAQAKISKVLHMHLARHTFATTVTLSNGVPIETVSNMLGHSTLRQTQHYAKVVAQKVKNDMAKLKAVFLAD